MSGEFRDWWVEVQEQQVQTKQSSNSEDETEIEALTKIEAK